jgi:putative heme-binding domain-containing protein
LKRASQQKDNEANVRALHELLEFWTGEALSVEDHDDGGESFAKWREWFVVHYPALAEELAGRSAGQWQDRLASIELSDGVSDRGKVVFEKRQCHGCHAGESRFGPDLEGVTRRLSKDALLTAIVDPNRDVAPAYETRMVVTESGTVYHGLQVYESPESTLLQTGPNEVIRVAGEKIISNEASQRSLMPEGLLDEFSDRDVADLFAFLESQDAR